MSTHSPSAPTEDPSDEAVWKALANPIRRRILDRLRHGPRTTGELAESFEGLSRYAVMQHLSVLTDAKLVLVRREGRERFNYLNAVPVRQVYERWVTRLAGHAAQESLGLWRAVHQPIGDRDMESNRNEFRVVRIENELRFNAEPERVFDVLINRVQEWFPASYGGERTQAVRIEPRVNGAVYEDWGDEAGYLYGHVTTWDPPSRASMRTRLHPGTVMDTSYTLEPEEEATLLKMSRVVTGPITDEEAEGIGKYGDLRNFEDALRAVIEAE